MQYITFSIPRFKYESVLEILPKPSGINARRERVEVTYSFRQKNLSGQHMIRVGLIKKSIENLFQHQVSWIGADHGTGLVYGINEFYHKYCTYKKYPKWVWTKHRKQLVSNAMRYAQRLHENGLFCFEMVLGYLYIQNQRLSSKIIKYEVLEKKARWVTAKTYERIDRGDFKKLEDAELQQARSVAGKKGADASATVRKAKSQQQKTQVKKLFDKGYSVNEIVGRLSISKRTVYRYIKE